MATCPQCGGRKKRVCPFCADWVPRGCVMCEDGLVDCPDCHGTGERE